ncbi:hypothetical protein HPB47_010996 [Ixodes persulcatus]|uniref:Uncharacterized protein n=1 Tax=Ixodes persulcatus TaxID=34615 RepID=A0AC60NXQ5_IXOPE|nr:hypothetical protein HPB47_010996 [Ixodes persulcatus]
MEEEFIGCGRGGRGALLRAALQKQTRRPGTAGSGDSSGDATSPSEESRPASGLALPSGTSTSVSSPSGPSPSPAPPVGAGRGALLERLMLQSRASTSSSSSGEAPSPTAPLSSKPGASCPDSSPPTAAVGRPEEPTAPPPMAAPPSPLEPPVEEMQELTVRQYRGKAGKPVSVEVNYVRLETAPGMGVFEYHVNFVPVIDSKKARFQLVRSDPVVERIGCIRVFDGAKLYLPHQLPDKVTSVVAPLPTDGTPVTVQVKFVKVTPPSQCVHLYNVLFKKVMHCLQLTQIGRNYFDHKGKILIPQHKLEVWPGYVQSVGEFEGGLLLNCDASFRVLRTVTARDVLYDVFNAYRQEYKTKALQAIVGNIVLTRYNNKTYRVDDISWDLKPTSTFTYHTGEEIAYMDYYKRIYNIDIQDTEQPLLLHRDKPRRDAPEGEEPRLVCLVPELCVLTGLTDEMRSDFRIMKDIAGHTRVNPNQRQLALQQFVKNVQACPEAMKVLNDWGVRLQAGAVTLDGRILPEEKVMMSKKSYQHNGTADWGRLLSQDSVIRPVHLQNWVVMHTRRDGERTRGFTSMMSKVCPSMGIQVQPPIMRELPSDSTESYVRAIKEVLNQNVQVIVLIFPTSRDDRYSAVIISNTIGQQQKLRSVTQKVALQINCKLGGELWAVEIPMHNVMVIGIDVYHDVTRGRQSVMGFVASMNQSLTRWFSKCAFQEPGKELVNCIKIAMLEAIVKYYEVNHKHPDRIFVFRDGVGDGQLSYVSDYEIEQLVQSFVNVSPDYKPSIAVVVVQKRINTRIFARLNGGRELDNPTPGTVVDHEVTRRDWCDFFLVSQKVRQGTVSPTHYIVVRNTTELSPDQMQRLAYKLTHLYYNWPGTIRVPAPCQYAHKLANLVGDSIHKEPSPLLSDRLFYL